MEFKIKDEETGNEITLQAQPEDYNGTQGWRIIFPEKNSFVIVETKLGEWEVVDEPNLSPKFVQAIGDALQPLARDQSKLP